MSEIKGVALQLLAHPKDLVCPRQQLSDSRWPTHGADARSEKRTRGARSVKALTTLWNEFSGKEKGGLAAALLESLPVLRKRTGVSAD
jgi:hypothetical protein